MWAFATPEQFELYQKTGFSRSMMDHYYETLLHIANFDQEVVRNEYLVRECNERIEPIVNICLEYGRTGVVPVDTIKSYI